MAFGAFMDYIHASPKEGFTQNTDDEGYLVEHPEALANVEGYSGGLRWVPKSEFEFTHLPVKAQDGFTARQLRVVVEHEQLNIKLSALSSWLKGDTFLALKMRDRDLLLEQCRLMTQLLAVLEERIARMAYSKKK